MRTLQKDGKTLSYLIVTKKIKHTYFKIKPDHVLVTTSRLTPVRVIESFLLQKFEQMHQKIAEIQTCEDPMTIKLQAISYQMIIHEGPFSYHQNDGYLIVYTRDKDMLKTKQRIYHQEVKHMVALLASEIEQVLINEGIAQRPFTYKYLKSKFGSYHRKKETITINTFLATQPIDLLKYVILHEYAHVMEFNHSKRFYNVLDRWLPNHRTLQKRLKNIAIY